MHPLRRLLSKNAGIVAAGSGLLVGLFGVAVAIPEPDEEPDIARVLFDAGHAGPGVAGPAVSTSMPDPEQESRYPAAEDDWTGTLSAWGVGLRRTGRYVVKTLPPGRSLGYGDKANRLDLRHFDVLVLPAPSRPLAAVEVAALTRWVRDGGGLFVITDRRSRAALAPLDGLVGAPAQAGHRTGTPPGRVPGAPGAHPLLDGSFGQVPGTVAGHGMSAREVGNGRVVTWAGLAAVQDGTGAGTGTAGSTGAEAESGAGTGTGAGMSTATGTDAGAETGAGTDAGTGAAPGSRQGWDDLGAGNDTLALNATEWLAGR